MLPLVCCRRQSPPACTSTGAGRTSPTLKKRPSIELKKPVFKDRAVQSDSGGGGESGMNLQENGLDQQSLGGIHVRSSPAMQAGSISDPVRHEPQVWRWVSPHPSSCKFRCLKIYLRGRFYTMNCA